MKKFLFVLYISAASTLLAQSYGTVKQEVMSLYKQGDKVGAVAQISQYIGENPKSLRAQNLLATLFYWQRDYKKSKSILTSLLAQGKLEVAETMLARVDRKLAKKVGKKESLDAFRALKKANISHESSDLYYLAQKVQDSPNDVKTRMTLVRYYFNHDKYQKAYDVAYETLEIDPYNIKMKKMKSHLEKVYHLSYSDAIDDETMVGKSKARTLLKALYKQKRYNTFFNLYKALNDAHVLFTKKENVDYLLTAIALKKYQIAKNIIDSKALPKHNLIPKVKLLLTQKLLSQVASL